MTDRNYTCVANAMQTSKSKRFKPTVQGVGYLGIGKFKSRDSVTQKQTVEYKTWLDMLKRCYNKEYQESKQTYKGCTVCLEWHNFQNFAEWYTSQEHYGKGYQLDKDWLVEGNKIYSPSTCVLAPKTINSLIVDNAAKRGKYPMGVVYNKKNRNFNAQININKTVKLGVFQTAEEASKAYQKAKKNRIKEVALEWQDLIDERLFNAMMNRAA